MNRPDEHFTRASAKQHLIRKTTMENRVYLSFFTRSDRFG
jgi:hypothetical protein